MNFGDAVFLDSEFTSDLIVPATAVTFVENDIYKIEHLLDFGLDQDVLQFLANDLMDNSPSTPVTVSPIVMSLLSDEVFPSNTILPYAVPQAEFCPDPNSEAKSIEIVPEAYVKSFNDYPNTVIAEPEIEYLKSLELEKNVSNIQSDSSKIHSLDPQFKRNKEINRLQGKKIKRKQTSNIYLPEHQSVIPSARQQAALQRTREKGKFKKSQIKWISVAELFKNSGI